uniref:dehydrogenase/reductase SDR family member 1-like n=1 Tax=Ciona intestinalis TaxID=7719 RepID=UPI000180C379|nr:dehydrogenase/reductase SDR family member 1-like [Ciona intestinalis]|eukprot:XP_009861303.1 dehydrogenase/reductase SDR family member 1-like [Ciona intestinalis]
MPNLEGKVCLVTGASRGIGKGIALQLITNGATCYITGRDIAKLEDVKAEAKHRGAEGKCIPVQCDHSKDEEIKKLFEQISNEQNETLDLLVNNAYSAITFVFENAKTNFWDQPMDSWDQVNNVGLRNHYLCTVYASRMMVKQRQGLIINMSSAGAIGPLFTPLYGIGKAAIDRMVTDCATELKKYNVAFLSLWPGPVKTELLLGDTGKMSDSHEMITDWGETPEFCGKAVSHLLCDKNIIRRSGQVWMTTDIADEHGYTDIDGNSPASMRSFKLMFALTLLKPLAPFIPRWIKVPFWLCKIILPLGAPLEEKKKSKYE